MQTEYKLYFNNEPATSEQLSKIEDIIVNQAVGESTVALITIPICLDEKGNWIGEDEPFMISNSRIRLELRHGSATYVPLIDGMVAKVKNSKDAEPGRSQITLEVLDDCSLLGKSDSIQGFENMRYDEVARRLYSQFQNVIISMEIETTDDSIDSTKKEIMQRGTAMEQLNKMASQTGFYAYLRPHETKGKNIGYFKTFPKKAGNLPALYLSPPNRNLQNFEVLEDNARNAVVQASALQVDNKKIVTKRSSYSDQDHMGDDDSAFQNSFDTNIKLPYPGSGSGMNPEGFTKGEMEEESRFIEAKGSTRGDCYNGILQTFEVVPVHLGNTGQSGDYEIHQVTHTITRSAYLQSFTMKRNAKSERKKETTGKTEKIF